MVSISRYSCAKRIFLIDCQNIPETDRWIITLMNGLQDAITLTRGLLAESNWTHFGVTVIKESKADVLLPILPWKSVETRALAKVFGQVQSLLLEEIEDINDMVRQLKKDHLLKGLESASRQLKRVKTQGSLSDIVLITFNWENQYDENFELQVEELVRPDASLQIQVIDLTCSVKASSTIEQLYIRSFQQLNFDLDIELLLKSWTSVKRQKVTVAFQKSQNTLCGEMVSLCVDPLLLQIERNSSNVLLLNIIATIDIAEVNQKNLLGICKILIPEHQKPNLEGWNAVWQYLHDSNVALVGSTESPYHHYLLVSGQEYTLILQPVINTKAVSENSKLEEIILTQQTSQIKVPILPLMTEFGLGKLSELIL